MSSLPRIRQEHPPRKNPLRLDSEFTPALLLLCRCLLARPTLSTLDTETVARKDLAVVGPPESPN